MNKKITNNQVEEIIKCHEDPIYFTNNYLKLDKNLKFIKTDLNE